MRRYYTRACNFYFGNLSKSLVSKKKSIPLQQLKEISFDQIEIITRKSKKIISKTLVFILVQYGGRSIQKIKLEILKILKKSLLLRTILNLAVLEVGLWKVQIIIKR